MSGAIPGLGGIMVAMASGKAMPLVASATGSDASIEIPGTVAAGDLCIIWNIAASQWAGGEPETPADTPGAVTPSGFTVLRNTTAGDSGNWIIRHMISAKRLAGSETTVTGMSVNSQGGNYTRWVCAVFRPSFVWSSWTDNDTGNAQGTAHNPTSQTITSSGATDIAFLYGGMASNAGASISPRSTSPTMTEITGDTYMYSHYAVINSGQNYTYDMGDHGDANVLQSGWLSFT